MAFHGFCWLIRPNPGRGVYFEVNEQAQTADSADFEITSRRVIILTPERTVVRDGVEI